LFSESTEENVTIPADSGGGPLFYDGTIGFRPVPARIWFHFVERVAGNHIDEWLLTRELNQEGTL
jgi:hypothetical protein